MFTKTKEKTKAKERHGNQRQRNDNNKCENKENTKNILSLFSRTQ